MNAQEHNSSIAVNCKVESQENQYLTIGNFQNILKIDPNENELDQIEAGIEVAGQQWKRQALRAVLEAADVRVAKVAQAANPDLHKHGSRPFTIVARCGKITFKRQRLFNPKKTKTQKTFIPSAIAWETSQHEHITAGVVHAACKQSQKVPYREAAANLAQTAGLESLICASTVWNKKQQLGQELKEQQKQCVDKLMQTYEPILVGHHIVAKTLVVSQDVISEPSEELTYTLEQEQELEALIDEFVQPQIENPQIENPQLSESRTIKQDDDLTLKNPVSEQSEEDKKTILVQLDEVVTKSQEKETLYHQSG